MGMRTSGQPLAGYIVVMLPLIPAQGTGEWEEPSLAICRTIPGGGLICQANHCRLVSKSQTSYDLEHSLQAAPLS